MVRADFVCPVCLITEERKLGELFYHCELCGTKMNRKWNSPPAVIIR